MPPGRLLARVTSGATPGRRILLYGVARRRASADVQLHIGNDNGLRGERPDPQPVVRSAKARAGRQAVTAEQDSAFPRRNASEVCKNRPPKNRGRGESRVSDAPAAARGV